MSITEIKQHLESNIKDYETEALSYPENSGIRGFSNGLAAGIKEALALLDKPEIAAALERMTYPPIVRLLMAELDMEPTAQAWAAFGGDGCMWDFRTKPQFVGGEWVGTGMSLPVFKIHREYENPEPFLFFKDADNRWQWAGNPENQTT